MNEKRAHVQVEGGGAHEKKLKPCMLQSSHVVLICRCSHLNVLIKILLSLKPAGRGLVKSSWCHGAGSLLLLSDVSV